ncbi:MAG: MarC family protein [Hyperthermus sp.]|nr:MAG: MarC family protein [Hyperthermus sp.]
MREGFPGEGLAESILLLFMAIDPLGNAPLFHAMTFRLARPVRRRIVERSVIVAATILLSFAVAGDILLGYFGLSLADFRIAGGMVLLLYGIMGILGHTEATLIKPVEVEAEVEGIAIVPLATPLLAGPAAIATVLYVKALYGLRVALVSVLVNTMITYAMLYYSEAMLGKLGRNGSIALAKIISILLTAIAVSMVRKGVEEAIYDMRKTRP